MSQTFQTSKFFELISQSAQEFKHSEDYTKALDLLFSIWQQQGTVFTMGCGGSASTATHFAADLSKTVVPKFNYKHGFKAISLVDNIPLASAWTNDEGWANVFAGPLRPWLTSDDLVVGFSVHGAAGSGSAGPWSQNQLAAFKLAQERGAKTLAFVGFDGGMMKKMADVSLVVPVDFDPYGTPVIEAFHVVLHHCLIFDLKQKISNSLDL